MTLSDESLDRHAARLARYEQVKAYRHEHQGDYDEITTELGQAIEAYLEFAVAGGLKYSEALSDLTRHVVLSVCESFEDEQ